MRIWDFLDGSYLSIFCSSFVHCIFIIYSCTESFLSLFLIFLKILILELISAPMEF